jgi:hypothetical protein
MATEFVKLIPSILWFFFVVVLFILFYRPIKDDLLPNLTSLKAAGLKLSFVKESLNAALKFETFSTPLRRIQLPLSRSLTATLPRVYIHKYYIFFLTQVPAIFRSDGVDFPFADTFKSRIEPISLTSEIRGTKNVAEKYY